MTDNLLALDWATEEDLVNITDDGLKTLLLYRLHSKLDPTVHTLADLGVR